MKLSLEIIEPDWKVVFIIPQGTILEKGRHGIYHQIVEAAGMIQSRFCCYAWGTKETIYYCGSVASDYSRGGYKSNLQGRAHNYLQNHRTRPNGRINTNLMVFENLRKTLVTDDVYLCVLTFETITIGNEQVSYVEFANDSDLVRATEQLLIASYKRINQCAWNRTPSTKQPKEIKVPQPGKSVPQAGISDQIRNYVLENFIIPARKHGEKSVTFTSREIHEGMKLHNSFPLVCNAIDAHKFLVFASVILVSRDGPKRSSTVRWVFDLG